ncbi:MAG: sulfotransferase [Pseudomonadota bacterium]
MCSPPVMVLGCGRSGTSILGELFEAVPGYTYRSEPPIADVFNADYTRAQAFKVPREDAAFGADPGLSFRLSDLQTQVPEMRFLWIVRHPLDAISSLRVGIAKNWGHHPRPVDWQDWLERPLIEQCAHHWAYLNRVGYDHVAGLALVVRFEDIVLSPAETLQYSLLPFLGLEAALDAPDVQKWCERVQNTNNEQFVEAKTSRSYSRSDHSVRVERWRENLTEADIVSVKPIISETAARFGYELP